MKSSTSSFRARGRSARIEPNFEACPLCGSLEIRVRYDEITVTRRGWGTAKVRVRHWVCPQCGEKFLTRASREQLDAAVGLDKKRTRPRAGG